MKINLNGKYGRNNMNCILNNDMKYIFENFNNPNIFENKTILITGCAGFLGFYISMFFIYLKKNNIKVNLILLDNFILNKPIWIKKIENMKNIKFYLFDIGKDDINEIKSSDKVDFIIHMASIASPTYYRKYPIQTIDANIWGLRNILEYYKKRSLDGILFFSSSEIYGNPISKYIPTSEEYLGNVSCIGPRACYDESKRFGETLCYVYSNVYNMPIRIVRPFNNYGPGMDINDKRVPADFARSIIKKENIIIYSDGSPTRTFCYISDAVLGYLKALIYNKFDFFNIGTDKPEISIKNLAEIYRDVGKELLNYKGKIIFKISKEKDYLTQSPLRRCPDITKAKKLLNFNPQIKIEKGVKNFMEYLIEGDD